MKLPAILVSDPHFTASPTDEYRWGLWPWLAGELTAEKAKTLIILGDLTDAKDYHPAELVNRLTAAIASMPVDDIIILAGNHDWLKQGGVFFEFLKHLTRPRVRVIVKPTEIGGTDDGPLSMFLPYTKHPAREWKDMDFSHYDYLFMHQTAPGSIASNGQEMEGEEMPKLNAGKVYSGDIHVPQKIGEIEYVGSPYHVHFGDRFKPRCIVIDRKRQAFDLRYETISRIAIRIRSVTELDEAGIGKGDQVKVALELSQADAHRWTSLRREIIDDIKARGAELHGVKMIIQKSDLTLATAEAQRRIAPKPEDAVYRYVLRHELGGDLLDVGLEIVER